MATLTPFKMAPLISAFHMPKGNDNTLDMGIDYGWKKRETAEEHRGVKILRGLRRFWDGPGYRAK